MIKKIDLKPAEKIAVRSNHKVDIRAVYYIAFCLIVIGILLKPAHAAEPFVLMKPSCYPAAAVLGLGNSIDVRVKMADGPDVLAWWCATPTGLEENYRAGEYGSIFEQGFRDAIKSLKQLWELDKSRFYRPLSDREESILTQLDALYEPRCMVTSTAKTTQVLSATDRVVGAPIRQRYPTTQRPSCYDWIESGSKRYCSVQGQLDTAGKAIEAGYVACKIALAPEEGWPQ